MSRPAEYALSDSPFRGQKRRQSASTSTSIDEPSPKLEPLSPDAPPLSTTPTLPPAAIPPKATSSSSTGKSLWEVAHIILDRDLYALDPIKYLQISPHHYRLGVRRLYQHVTITPGLVDLIYECSERPAGSRFLDNFRYTETIVVDDFWLLSALRNCCIISLEKAEEIIHRANPTDSEMHSGKVWKLPLFPNARSMTMPRSSFHRAGEQLLNLPAPFFHGYTSKLCGLHIDFTLGPLFSPRKMTEFIEYADESYSEDCIPVIYLAEINLLLGGNLKTFTSVLGSRRVPTWDAPIPQGKEPANALHLDVYLRRHGPGPPANTITIRTIYNDPPGTVRVPNYWKSIEQTILSWSSIVTSAPHVKHVNEIHIYQAAKAKEEVLKLQGGVAEGLLEAKPFEFVEVDYEAFPPEDRDAEGGGLVWEEASWLTQSAMTRRYSWPIAHPAEDVWGAQ
ncbi:hypothetical protein L198_00059 [Cryptococcus wingfieldii CBS 7118]|uniref:Uncharacterized protein n=1 Tax=Cryptococcus wingfieldii CBS 7118 TaxID=1295528 RepID=A0A1E3K5P1_9TREE|nr:hypothetical protein L198_00059 [Cryptococcus wingfieldii CBS 7118]ODO08335.1 hypothetical protein L198_00059 [Cryptococcus wingfieldii CBS 7118]